MIVFYTYGLFSEMLQNVPVSLEESIREITPRNHFIICGKKHLAWWERSCKMAWTDNLRLLVTGHPERMNRHEFVEVLTNWLR